MATNWPFHQFVLGNSQVVLYIEGHKFYLNQRRSDKVYFYCQNKKKEALKCKASAQAVEVELDGEAKFLLRKYNPCHSPMCVPSVLNLKIKETKEAIKKRVQASPSIKPSMVYNEEVNKVRDNLSQEE